jgi:hypothetical protein
MRTQAEAIRAVQECQDVCISPEMAAPVIGATPQWIRVVARENPQRLGFRVISLGSRTKIPRIPFLRYLGIEEEKREPNL